MPERRAREAQGGRERARADRLPAQAALEVVRESRAGGEAARRILLERLQADRLGVGREARLDAARRGRVALGERAAGRPFAGGRDWPRPRHDLLGCARVSFH
ncbi:MAG: hypothetical protein HYZ53_00335 [Planctomycetes bacterium]|nr:hypothetical protein [Planctomycetota bacterium]